MESMHFVCCTDNNFVMQTSVMMKSICYHHRDVQLNFHVVIDDSVSEADKQDMLSVVDNNNHKVDFHFCDNTILSEYPRVGALHTHVTKAAYYRLFLTALLPDTIDKAIYLDGDIIVRHPLQELWNIDISDYAVGVVPDGDEGDPLKYNQMKYPLRLGYFNSGVLLINLKYWREHNCMDEFLNFIVDHPERINFHDQDVLNCVFCERKMQLPFKFNTQTSFFYSPTSQKLDYYRYENEIVTAVADPYVLHFCFVPKPWIKECLHPMKQEFFKYLAMTKWKDYQVKSGLTSRDKLRKIGEKLGILSKLAPEPFDKK